MNFDYLKAIDQQDLDDERDNKRFGNDEFDYLSSKNLHPLDEEGE